LNELRKLRDAHRSVQVVEEQKRGLETELQVLKDVERQLGEAQIQREILEDEKRQWATLLERDGQDAEFSSPEAVVKALVQTRIELASMSERMGSVEADIAEKDEMIRSLETDNTALKEEVGKAKSGPSASAETMDGKAYKRLERQKNLVEKEVDYLRAQLKAFDAEETTMMDNKNFDQQRAAQVSQLEALVDEYRSEIATLNSNMVKLESIPAPEPRGTKRSADSQEAQDDASSQVGPILRKNKNLQVALQKKVQQSKMLAIELQAANAQLKGLRESTKTRVLELKDNPTANIEAIKMSTLRTLKEESKDLLAQLRGENLQGVKVVPVSTVDALQLNLQEKDQKIAEKEKRMKRQREIWTDKANEFRDVIASVLGWRITFLPNGKAKVSSMFHGRGEVEEDDQEYIVFDGENGTMKISGGSDGAFAREIKQNVDFWVKERKEIPCFLAALTMQFHDEYRSS
jgi:mitotic spindle assembly checkpoint protein MAD1